jgi:predicted DsbA family dithiol-disulfide isomerase
VMKTIQLDVYSDLICPWCYVGKRRMEAAIEQLGADTTVNVSWHPFELNPQMPPAGMNRKEYRSAKFGSWHRSQELDAQVTAAGAEVGIAFNYRAVEKTPNTLDSHRLVLLAKQHELEGQLVEQLFHAYFVEGRDLTNPSALGEVATSAGLPAGEVQELLAGDRGLSEVRAEEAWAQEHGLTGVPYFSVNGQVGFSGAQPVASFLRAFADAEVAKAQPAEVNGAFCSIDAATGKPSC